MVLLPPGCAIGGLSAAWLWGVDLLPLTAPPVCAVVPHVVRRRGSARLTIMTATLTAEDVTTIGGIAVTTPERTAFDLGRGLTRTGAVIALDAMLHRRLITESALQRLIDMRGRSRGVPALRAALALADAQAESPMETRVRLLLHDAGLPAPTAQHDVFHRGRFIARVDFAYPAQRLVIEYEGDYHRERAAFRFDLARVNDLVAAGWLVIRVTADDVHKAPRQLIARVRAALTARAGGLGRNAA